MDAIDVRILERLAQNAREKATAISKEVNLSVSAVIERIHKMEESGVIQGYAVRLGQKQLGNGISAWMEVTLENPRFCAAFEARAREMENIVTCHYLTGNFDFMLYVVTHSSDALEAIHAQIKGIEGVASTKTYFVLRTVKENTCVLPEADE